MKALFFLLVVQSLSGMTFDRRIDTTCAEACSRELQRISNVKRESYGDNVIINHISETEGYCLCWASENREFRAEIINIDCKNHMQHTYEVHGLPDYHGNVRIVMHENGSDVYVFLIRVDGLTPIRASIKEEITNGARSDEMIDVIFDALVPNLRRLLAP